ncbi:MAG TPA: OmpH family outer membrane protein [Longimicrobiaceae bacterium]|nr:OmpH family outer membrane protein [Longimicrobiaceae bacterium]
MKNSLVGALGLGLAMLFAAAVPANAQAGAKLAYINSQKILAEAPGAAAAQATFESDMETYRAEIETMGAELEALRADYERQQATLSEEAKLAKQQEIQQKFTEYQQRVAELEQTAQRRQAELVSPIMQEISAVIEQIRTEGGYAMIFDAAAGTLITADPALDLTATVLARLQSSPSGQ